MIWNESIECMDRESLRKIQSIRLKKNCRLRLSQHSFLSKEDAGNGNNPPMISIVSMIL